MTVTEIPADDSGDEEEQTKKADREDALILPAWTSGPSAAVVSRRDHDRGDDHRDKRKELDVHCVTIESVSREVDDARSSVWPT